MPADHLYLAVFQLETYSHRLASNYAIYVNYPGPVCSFLYSIVLHVPLPRLSTVIKALVD